ncbi:MAG: GGDEF domain-containing protein [Trueperaceae bacterium]|nr:GGDEF domain-containing protein [Trueperaceae bacterium]
MGGSFTWPSHEHLRAIYEHMVDGILVVNAQGVVVCANPAASRMLSGNGATIEGKVFGFPIVDRNAVVIDLIADLRGVRSAEMRVSAVEWRGEPAHLLSLRDITEQVTLIGDLERAANFDTVTGLPNRSQFHQRLEHAVRESRRHAGLVALLFIDLDDFKAVNDLYGHGIGDEFLALAGRRLEALLRENDTLARLGGDEFTVVLTQLQHPREAEVVANKIIKSFRAPFDIATHAINCGASIGITVFPQDADTVEDLVRKADSAMYVAKNAGKSTYRFYSSDAESPVR